MWWLLFEAFGLLEKTDSRVLRVHRCLSDGSRHKQHLLAHPSKVAIKLEFPRAYITIYVLETTPMIVIDDNIR